LPSPARTAAAAAASPAVRPDPRRGEPMAAPTAPGPRLHGKTAIVTGGAGGIGRGITAAFVKAGADVLFVDINADAGAALESELDSAGHPGRAAFRHVDISDDDGPRRVVDAAVEEFGGVSVLVNNAHASRQVPL